MLSFWTTSLALLPDLCLIALGFSLGRWMPMPLDFWTGAERLVYYVLFPALLFYSVLKAPINLQMGFSLVLAGWLTLFAGMLGAWLLWPFLRRLSAGHARDLTTIQRDWASTFQCGFRFNSYVGLALIGRLAGAEGVAQMGILIGCMVPLANIASVTALAMSQPKRVAILPELARNPLIVATLSGLLCKVAGVSLPEFMGLTLERLGAAAVALGLVCVGTGLRLQAVVQNRLLALWMNAIKLLLMPAVALVLVQHLGLTPLAQRTVVLFAALPTASSGFILAARMGGNAPLVASVISLSTLLSMLALPFWLAWLAG